MLVGLLQVANRSTVAVRMMVGQALSMGEAVGAASAESGRALGGGWGGDCCGEWIANRDVVVLRRDMLVDLLQVAIDPWLRRG